MGTYSDKRIHNGHTHFPRELSLFNAQTVKKKMTVNTQLC